MVLLYDGTAVGGREIAMSTENIQTISGAFASGVAILQGPVDITKPTTIETLNTSGEDVINPFSEKVDNSLFNGFPTPQPEQIVNVASPQVDNGVSQQTVQPDPTLSAAPQPVAPNPQIQPSNPTPQPNPTLSTTQLKTTTSLGKVEPQQSSIQGSPAPQFQPVANYSVTSETNIFDTPTAATAQPDQTLSAVPQSVASDSQIQPSNPTPQPDPTNQPYQENITPDSQLQSSAPVPQNVTDANTNQPTYQENTAPVAPQVVASEEQNPTSLNNQPSGEVLVDNNIGINSIALSSPLFTKDVIAGIRITKEETLYDVSVRVGIPVDLLSSVNNVTDMNLKPGQFLLLPPGLQKVYKYEIEIFSDISKRIPDMLNNQKTPEQDLNGIGEGFRI